MLKQILKLNGVHILTKEHLRAIGGGINRCCIRVPTNGIINNEISDSEGEDKDCTDVCKKYVCCGGTTPNNSY